MEKIIEKLKSKGQKIATMESCTGGGLANYITNISGSSEVFEFGAVTYSNKFKIKMGVNSNIIEKFTVYSIETAKEMSKSISNFTNADYGVGITGKLNEQDPSNPDKPNDLVYVSIYIKEEDKYMTASIQVDKENRNSNKSLIIDTTIKILSSII